ncbi:MAG: outer membrane beta-barrel protein, partial [Verrucomicrobiota bacterium]
MKFNKWTMGLAAVGVVSLASAARADEKMSQVQTALSNTTFSGYVDTSAMWQLGSQNGGAHPAYTPNNNVTGDGFNLNSVNFTLDKPMDEGNWGSGYHVDLMLGPDAVGTPSVGGVRQAYLALRTPVGNSEINWKFGAMDAPIGYESSSDPLNPNYTRSFGYFLTPSTITGLLGTYKVNDMISFTAGIANAGTRGNARNGSPFVNSGVARETQKAY